MFRGLRLWLINLFIGKPIEQEKKMTAHVITTLRRDFARMMYDMEKMGEEAFVRPFGNSITDFAFNLFKESRLRALEDAAKMCETAEQFGCADRIRMEMVKVREDKT